MKKFIVIAIILYLGLLLFMPKLYLWYALEDYLNRQNIQLVSADNSTKLIALKLYDNRLYYKEKEIAKIRDIEFLPLIFFNRIILSDLNYDVREDILAKKTTFTHSILNPLKIKISSNGNFGDIVGEIDLREHKIALTSVPTKEFQKGKFFKKLFQKTDKGYIHESNF